MILQMKPRQTGMNAQQQTALKAVQRAEELMERPLTNAEIEIVILAVVKWNQVDDSLLKRICDGRTLRGCSP